MALDKSDPFPNLRRGGNMARQYAKAPKTNSTASIDALKKVNEAVADIAKRGKVKGELIAVRLQPDEIEKLDRLRGDLSRQDYLRTLLARKV